MNSMQRVANICRWIGRILGTIFVLFIVVFFLGDIAVSKGLLFPLKEPLSLGFHGLFFGLLLIVVGTLVGWCWELAGGLTALIWLSLLLVCQMFGLRGMPWFLGLPGILFLVSAALGGLEQRKVSA
jgi:hypothetical protein